jgi:hypothetical protein
MLLILHIKLGNEYIVLLVVSCSQAAFNKRFEFYLEIMIYIKSHEKKALMY